VDLIINVIDILGLVFNFFIEFWWLTLILFASPIITILTKKKTTKQNKISRQDFSKYNLKQSLLTKNEQQFYKTLKLVVGDKFVILSMVRLADIFSVKSGKKYYSYLERITQKHVDFLLCEHNSFKPIIGIELDDNTHLKPDRKKRDIFVNKVFGASGLPLLHIKVQKNYLPEDLAKKIISGIRNKDNIKY
jgi:hypothetical protein